MEKKETKISLFLTENRNYKFLIIGCLILGIIFMIAGNFISEEKTPSSDNQTYFTAISYTESLENRIEELCTSLAGITDAKVLLTLENGTESVYAGNTATQTSDTMEGKSYDYILVSRNNGEEPILLTEIYPTIRGVAVVCTNGNDSTVQLTVTKLLSASLGIPTNRIQVAGS